MSLVIHFPKVVVKKKQEQDRHLVLEKTLKMNIVINYPIHNINKVSLYFKEFVASCSQTPYNQSFHDQNLIEIVGIASNTNPMKILCRIQEIIVAT